MPVVSGFPFLPPTGTRPRVRSLPSILRVLAAGIAIAAAPAAMAATATADNDLEPASRASAARGHFLEARQLERAGDHAAALEQYRLAFRNDSTSRDLCFLFIERLKDAGEIDSAASLGETCLALAGDTLYTEHSLLGEIALRADDEAGALHHYRAAYRLNPLDADVLYMLAGLLEESGERDSTYLEILETLLPRLGYPARLMDRVLRAYAVADRVGELAPLLRDAWEHTRHPPYGRALAAWYDAEGLPLSVLRVARELAEVDPSPDHDWLLARAYRAGGRPDSALVLYDRLAKEHPENTELLHARAVLLFERGRTREARTAARALLRDDPGAPPLLYLAGSIDIELGRRGGRALLEAAVDAAPLAPAYRARLAYADHADGAPARAATRLEYAPDDTLDVEQALFLEGLAHGRLARELAPRRAWEPPAVFSDSAAAARYHRRAAERFATIVSRNSGHRAALFELGAHLERTGERDSAVKVLRRLVGLDSANAVAMNYLGYMLVEPDTVSPEDLEFSGGLLRRAVELEPENGAYLDSKGWWHYRNGDLDSARLWLERAAESAPSDPEILEHLAVVLRELGDRSAACRARDALLCLDPGRDPMPGCPEDTGERGRRR